nr:MAG TPA: hypothetical protein [Caudoviricetes sp.]
MNRRGLAVNFKVMLLPYQKRGHCEPQKPSCNRY